MVSDMNPSTGPSHFGSCPEILRGSCPLDFPRDSQSPAHFKVPEAPSLDSVHPSPSFEHSLPEGKSADSGFQELDVFPEECGERDQTSYVCDGIVEDGQSADKRVTPSGESTDGALAESTSLVENCTEQDGSDDDVVSHNDVSVTPLGNSTTTIPSALGPSDQAVNIEWAFEVEEIPLVAGVNAGLVRSSTSRRGARSSSRSVRFSLNETADPSVAIRPHRTDSDASSRISVDNGEVLLPSSLNVVADRDTSEASSPSIDGPSTLLPSPRVPRTQPSDTDVSRPPPAAAAATAPPPPVATTIQDDNSSVVHFPGDQGETEEGRKERVGGFWPHSPSALFASLACTVGPYNICRFSYLSYLYGGRC